MTCSEELVGCSRKECQPLEVKEIFTECTESALQTIEYGPLPEVQRYMLVLSGMLTGASVDHGRRPVLVSLSTFSAADTKELRNGTCNDQEPSREKWQATRTALPPDFKMAESWSSEEVNKGSQNATAAHQASSSSAVGASSVVSRSMRQTKMRKKKIFFHILGKYIC